KTAQFLTIELFFYKLYLFWDGRFFSCSRSSRFKNLPTEVLGIVSIKMTSSGSHHLGNKGRIKSSNASFDTFISGFVTTTATGRSCQCESSIATTAASATFSCAINAFSKSTEEIHSPPLFTKPFVGSTSLMYPSSSIVAISPLYNHPLRIDSLDFSGAL